MTVGRRRAWSRCGFWVCALLLASATSAAAQSQTREVLILNSFQRQPWAVHTEILRTELDRRSPEPINFFEVSILPSPLEPVQERSVVNYLQSTVTGRRLDLVVSVGGPAAVFAKENRERLFPTTPLLEAMVDTRFLKDSRFTVHETTVAGALDMGQIIDNMLVLLPETRTVFAVLGTSENEEFWRDELRREFQRFTERPKIDWLDGLSFAQVLERAAALPPNSTIFYLSMNLDAKGVLHSDGLALAQLHAVANAPLFGIYDFQMGRGIVGGPLMSLDALAKRAADVAIRILRGESPGDITSPTQGHGPLVYDWRELQRWGIREARLPAGSTVLYRQPGVWEQYRLYILAAATLVTVQSVLIAGLVVQRVRRRRTERALRDSELRFRDAAERNQDLAVRLMNAQEEERTRIARDLHDDVSQQLAGLGIMLSGLKRKVAKRGPDPDVDGTMAMIQNGTATLAERIRNLSHELHPSVLEHAGLTATLRRHCSDVEALHHRTVRFSADGDLDALGHDVALCLFRVAQEALSNAVRHARAQTIGVQLKATNEVVELEITDDGVGFVAGESGRRGLGLRSIDERVRQLRGFVIVESQPGHGTRIRARIPRARPAEVESDDPQRAVAGGVASEQ